MQQKIGNDTYIIPIHENHPVMTHNVVTAY